MTETTGPMIDVPQYLIEDAQEAEERLLACKKHFDSLTEQRKDAKDAMDQAQALFNELTGQILSCHAREGFPVGTPFSESGDDDE